MSDDAKMTTDPTTGGMKGSKAERYDLIPAGPLRELALHYGQNSVEHGGKYPARNWEKGYKWSLSFAAMMRHAWAMWRGEWLDPESPGGQTPHLVAVAWHAFAMLEWRSTHPELDDRPRPPPTSLRQKIEEAYYKQWNPPEPTKVIITPEDSLTPAESTSALTPRCDCSVCSELSEVNRCHFGCELCERQRAAEAAAASGSPE